jgi:hypothetical protein
MPPTKHLSRVMLKFRDAVNLPYADDIGAVIESQGVGHWKALAQQFPGLRILRLYRSISTTDLAALVRRGETNDPTYHPPNFQTYFVVETASPAAAAQVWHELRAWPGVEHSYVEPAAQSPNPINPAAYAMNGGQGYEDPSPHGIGARCAWTHPGGDGTGQAVIDLETGWTLDHDDFSAHHPTLLFGAIEPADASHGTSVLGIMSAVGNFAGIIGIAPNVQSVNVVSYKRDGTSEPTTDTIPDAIACAVQHLVLGNVLLLEVELNFLPCEFDLACAAAIRLATAAGISVIEAAGNGNQNLDTSLDSAGNLLFPGTPGSDSLAVIVASATTTVPHTRRANSNFGKRVNCYAWGDSVLTSASTGPSDLASHTNVPEFANTSAASAIIAGSALSVQGMRQAAGLPRLGPADLRAALMAGTPSADPIGVMPDLCAIGNTMLRHLPTDVPGQPRHVAGKPRVPF